MGSMMKASDVMELLGISESKSYDVIRQLNAELEEKGYMTLRGRVSAAYLHERFFGQEDKPTEGEPYAE